MTVKYLTILVFYNNLSQMEKNYFLNFFIVYNFINIKLK